MKLVARHGGHQSVFNRGRSLVEDCTINPKEWNILWKKEKRRVLPAECHPESEFSNEVRRAPEECNAKDY